MMEQRDFREENKHHSENIWGTGKGSQHFANYMKIWIGTQSFKCLKHSNSLNIQFDHSNELG